MAQPRHPEDITFVGRVVLAAGVASPRHGHRVFHAYHSRNESLLQEMALGSDVLVEFPI